ncbi:hypothetical protein HYT26_04745, partial [Candidatus Pacearchaeota archaeon]|nr:hypothetical protein [Candidatus Pacearchaeota archaeon]
MPKEESGNFTKKRFVASAFKTFSLNTNTLTDRIAFQKTIYLMQNLGSGTTFKFVWHNFGPFSSIFLMPFVAIFGREFPQYFIGIFSMTSSFILIYSISRKFKFDKLDSLWLSLFFVFS